MGNCSPSQLNAFASSYYDVYNVDARLFKHSKGQIQITNNQLVLHQKTIQSCEQIKWPLNGVRRYGYYKDIFLFESGRKCPTGEGLFAFKCNNAKRLNDALHKAIINNATRLCNLQEENTNYNTGQSTIITTDTLVQNSDGTNSILESKKKKPKESNLSIIEHDENDYPANNSSNRTESKSSPYYINDINNIVRLPLNLFETNNGDTTKNNYYINSDLISPAILHLAKKLNVDPSKSTLNNNNYYNVTSLPNRSESAKKLKDVLSSKQNEPVPELDYVIPERIGENVIKNDNYKNDENTKENDMRNRKYTDSNGSVEYTVIDAKKTPAIKSSTDLIKQRRMDYSNLKSVKK